MSIVAMMALALLVPRAANALPEACRGDCNGDFRVAVEELISAVNAALGRVEPCTSLDADGDGVASIDEVVGAVASSIAGCMPASSPTSTATASPTQTTSTPSPTPSPTPTEIGLGTRRFTIDPKSSPLTAVLGADHIVTTLPGFSGFLALRAGEPDPATGLALVDVVDSSDYIAIDIPSQPAALCIHPLRDQFPIAAAGVVACNGGLPVGFVSRQDHRIGVVGECSGGNAAGSECSSDDECPGAHCFHAADCEKAGGQIEAPPRPHPGVCNGPIGVGFLPSDSGAGAVWIVPGLLDGLTRGLPVEILMEGSTPCGDEGVAATPAVLALTSGTVRVEVEDAGARRGESLSHEVTGESFSCDAWREANGPGTLVFGAPGLDVRAVGAAPADVLTFFVLDD